MKIISFDEGQGSEEWVKWRKCGIGASDIAIITGSNSYSTPLKLWEIKCGFRNEDPVNFAMAHGIKNEDVARQWLNENLQFNLKAICVEDSDNPQFRASLDGWDFDSHTLVEIKCPISEGILDKARLTQSIPGYWFDQMQWQIMLTNPKRAIMAIWDYRHNSCITVEMFGIESQIKKMRTKAKEFWHGVQIGKAPDPNKDDFLDLSDPELKEYLLEYRDLSDREKSINLRRKELKAKIETYGGDGNFKAFGFRVQKIAAPGKYDIDQMRMDGVDVDLYYKKPTVPGWYRIYPPKK